MKNQISQIQCKTFERNGQQMFSLNTEVEIPETSEVRFIDTELEKLDYSKLYGVLRQKGRKSVVDAKTMFKVIVYAYERGIYSSRKIEEACRVRIDFRWLLNGEKIPDHCAISRFRKKHKEELEDFFCQYVRILEAEEETDHEVVFIDGTKVESRAGRYTFVWRGRVEKDLAKAKAKLYETTGTEDVAEAEAKVAELVSGLIFVTGKGHHKSEKQKEAENILGLLERIHRYEKDLEIMGPDRNSYSKTDPDATFMRMKEDHMRNGQLKPGYNLQFAVNSEYITGLEVYADRTDTKTLIPFLKAMEEQHGEKYKKVSADAGYESYDNYCYLEENGQMSFIKPTNYETKRTKKYRQQIGRMENMTYLEEGDCFVCAEGRILQKAYDTTDTKGIYPRKRTYYRCEDCSHCSKRSLCSKAKSPETPKEICMTKGFEEARRKSEKNLGTDEGIRIRVSRSIQVEGAFGLMKHDYGFRRFLTFQKENVRTELFYFALGFNLRKRYNKVAQNREKTHYNYVNSA